MSAATEYDLAHTYCGVPFTRVLSGRASVVSYLTHHARIYGDDPYVTAVSAEGEAVTYCYRQVDAHSRQLASWLRDELRVHPGDVVALLPANDITSVGAVFGLLRSGCAILFLNPTAPVGRLRQQTEALNVKAALRVPSVSADVLPGAILTPDGSALGERSTIGPDPPIQPGHDAFFFGTSGSTAASKLVAQSHYNAAINAEAVCRHHRLRRGDRLLGCLPIYHVNGLHFTLLATLAAGAHAILAHSFDPFVYPQLIERFRPRIASVVPSILEALLGTWRQRSFPGEFDYFVSAAAPLAARTAREVARKMNVRVLQGYGLSETTNFSTTMPADLSQEAYQRLVLDAEIPSVGTAFYGNEVALLTADGDHVAPGEIGEICMRGHNVMMRYAGNDAETAAAFRGGWFHSQDLGYEIRDADLGRSFFVITGRIKNIAKVRGEAVSLDEMDRVLSALPYVRDAACVSLPNRFLGDEIIAAVVLSRDARDTPDADLRTHLRATFAPTVLPGRFVRLDAIPRTPTGKILRAELAQKLALLGYEGATQGERQS